MLQVTSNKSQILGGRRVNEGDVVSLPCSHARLLVKQGVVHIERKPRPAKGRTKAST